MNNEQRFINFSKLENCIVIVSEKLSENCNLFECLELERRSMRTSPWCNIKRSNHFICRIYFSTHKTFKFSLWSPIYSSPRTRKRALFLLKFYILYLTCVLNISLDLQQISLSLLSWKTKNTYQTLDINKGTVIFIFLCFRKLPLPEVCLFLIS